MSSIHAHTTDGTPEEDAYRRGFQQGSEEAFKLLSAPDEVIESFRKAVRDWRFDASHKTEIRPPNVRVPGSVKEALKRRREWEEFLQEETAKNLAEQLMEATR